MAHPAAGKGSLLPCAGLECGSCSENTETSVISVPCLPRHPCSFLPSPSILVPATKPRDPPRSIQEPEGPGTPPVNRSSAAQLSGQTRGLAQRAPFPTSASLLSSSLLFLNPRPNRNSAAEGGSAVNKEHAGRKGQGTPRARSFFASRVPNGFEMKNVPP